MTIGQRVAPSFADVKRINLAYCNCESYFLVQLNEVFSILLNPIELPERWLH